MSQEVAFTELVKDKMNIIRVHGKTVIVLACVVIVVLVYAVLSHMYSKSTFKIYHYTIHHVPMGC